MPMSRVELTPEEFLVGAVSGVYRRIRSHLRGKRDRHGHSGFDVWSMDIEGALAELAVAKLLGVYWSGQQGVGTRDVLGYEIRQTSYADGHLILHKSDTDDVRYLLVTGQLGTYDVRGYVYGHEGKREEFWSELQRGRPAFNVPQDALRVME